jgi:hypothetical protein
LNIVFVLLGTRDSFVRIVHLATKEIQRDWDLLVHVFHVTAKGEGLAIQTQEIVILEMRILTSNVLTVPLVSTMIPMTPAAASRAPVTMGSAAQ